MPFCAPEGHEDEMRGGDLNLRPFALAADYLAVILSAAISEAANDRQALSSLRWSWNTKVDGMTHDNQVIVRDGLLPLIQRSKGS